jgi:hypothetical protein
VTFHSDTYKIREHLVGMASGDKPERNLEAMDEDQLLEELNAPAETDKSEKRYTKPLDHQSGDKAESGLSIPQQKLELKYGKNSRRSRNGFGRGLPKKG